MQPNLSGLYSTTAFSGKVIGITGAASGIGKSMAELFTHMGASVLLVDVNEHNLQQVYEDLKGAGHDVQQVVVDVAQAADLQRAADALKKHWGKLDGWVNNAGINRYGTVEEQEEEKFRECWEVNTLAAWRTLKYTAGLFPPTGGAIVNISSILAWRTRPKNMAYASSKAALEGLTRGMAIELAPRNIRVNCIVPGSIRVQPWVEDLRSHGVEYPEYVYISAELFTISGKMSQPISPNQGPESVANLAAFLLSDANSFVTGESIIVDGGFHAEMKTATEHTSQQVREVILPAIELREKRDRLQDEALARGESLNPHRLRRQRRK